MAPQCGLCRAEMVGFVIPESIVEFAPAQGTFASLCRVCLTLEVHETAIEVDEPLSVISAAFPDDETEAAMIAILVGLLDSLALHRRAIQAVVFELESVGVDALLVLDRLIDDSSLRPAIDLDRRVYQLGQLLE